MAAVEEKDGGITSKVAELSFETELIYLPIKNYNGLIQMFRKRTGLLCAERLRGNFSGMGLV